MNEKLGAARPAPALKPCPFCGGVAAFGESDDGAFVNCTECCASTDTLTAHGSTRDEAAAAWNRRVSA